MICLWRTCFIIQQNGGANMNKCVLFSPPADALSENFKDISFTDYSPEWVHHRKFFSSSLRWEQRQSQTIKKHFSYRSKFSFILVCLKVVAVVQWLDCRTCNHECMDSNPTNKDNLILDWKKHKLSFLTKFYSIIFWKWSPRSSG